VGYDVGFLFGSVGDTDGEEGATKSKIGGGDYMKIDVLNMQEIVES